MRRLLQYILSFYCFFSLVSCIQNDETYPPIPPESEEIEANVRIATSPITFSGGSNRENLIKEIDILAFRKGSYGDFFEYRVAVDEGDIINTNLPATDKKAFSVKLRKNSNRYIFVFLANARAIVDASFSDLSSSPTSYSKEALLDLIIQTKSSWNINNDCIPMWGETPTAIQVIEELTIKDIYMLRALTRLDLKVNPTTASNFTLTGVYLYNRLTKGLVAPDQSPATWDASNKIVLKPTIPTLAGKLEGPLNYVNAADFITNEFVGKLYTYEAPAVQAGNDLDATCLVVRGNYTDENSVTHNNRFYRIDFTHFVYENGDTPGGGSVGTEFMPLLRNHIYETTIKSVSSLGEDNEDDAFRKKTKGMEVVIQSWEMHEVEGEIPGTYNLKVSSDNVSLRPGQEIEIKVESDNPSPWTVEIPAVYQSWITATKLNSTTLIIKVTTNNSASTGEVNIKVGTLSKKIKVNRILL